jgi:hypothetical protein
MMAISFLLTSPNTGKLSKINEFAIKYAQSLDGESSSTSHQPAFDSRGPGEASSRKF